MRAFLDYVVKGLVARPESVTVTPVARQGLTAYELRLHADDVGRVVGRKGNTIGAIRSLLIVGSSLKGRRCTVDIVEDSTVT